MKDFPTFLTVQQASEKSGFSLETVRKAISTNRLKATQPVGSTEYRILAGDLLLWLRGEAGNIGCEVAVRESEPDIFTSSLTVWRKGMPATIECSSITRVWVSITPCVLGISYGWKDETAFRVGETVNFDAFGVPCKGEVIYLSRDRMGGLGYLQVEVPSFLAQTMFTVSEQEGWARVVDSRGMLKLATMSQVSGDDRQYVRSFSVVYWPMLEHALNELRVEGNLMDISQIYEAKVTNTLPGISLRTSEAFFRGARLRLTGCPVEGVYLDMPFKGKVVCFDSFDDHGLIHILVDPDFASLHASLSGIPSLGNFKIEETDPVLPEARLPPAEEPKAPQVPVVNPSEVLDATQKPKRRPRKALMIDTEKGHSVVLSPGSIKLGSDNTLTAVADAEEVDKGLAEIKAKLDPFLAQFATTDEEVDEPACSSKISDYAHTLVNQAKRDGKSIVGSFNHIKITATPASSPEQVEASYWKLLNTPKET